MEPAIQYATTEDGVNIGFCIVGEGIPLVIVPPAPISHVQLEWQNFPDFYPPLAKSFRVVWYDSRGSGVSDRENIDFSMEAMLRDLASIVERLDVDQVVLAGFTHGVPIAATYAARVHERVSHLFLVDGYVKYSDALESAAYQAGQALLEGDWTIYTETLARVLSGYDQTFAGTMAEYIRTCVGQDALRAADAAQRRYDVSPLLRTIAVPTLVVHNRGHRFVPVRVAQQLAAAIPNGRLLVVDDLKYEKLPAIITEFVSAASHQAMRGTTSRWSGAFRTVLFTDVVGHTAMMSRLGDERGREVLREHERITREVLKAHGGTEVKAMGDGFMASFGSVTSAVECAIALQRAFAVREGEPLSVRVGLNAGEPIEEDGDLFGVTVIRASRIAAKAEGGEILVADTVRGLCSGKGFLFSDRGEFVAKGFEEPVRVYEVRWRDVS
jgi:pimeloyl-ACP methyl ester carboxylesterase